MAFASAPGYTNLPSGNFVPTIFSQKALKAFRKLSVVEAVTNTEFYGEIAAYGDTVRIIREPEITINAYTRGTTPVVQDLADDDFSVTVDKANYFAFAIDDVEKKQAHNNWEELASNRAAYKIKDAYDAEVLNYMAISATKNANYIGSTWSGSTETVNSVKVATGVTPSATAYTPLGIMARAQRIMDLANVPTDSRYLVADPVFYEQLSDENSKLLNALYTDKGILRNGMISDGEVRGFQLYKSNNLPTGGTGPDSASGSSANYGTLIFGHMSAVATVSQIAKTETFRSQERFADVVRGLHLYGRGIIRPESLVVVRYGVQ